MYTRVLSFLCAVGMLAGASAQESVLFDFEGEFDVSKVETRDVRVSLSKAGGNSALRIASGHAQRWPGISLTPPNERWDLSMHGRIAVDVRNVGGNSVRVGFRVDDAGAKRVNKGFLQRVDQLAPGETGVIELHLNRRTTTGAKDEFFGMRGTPLLPGYGGGGGGHGAIDVAKVIRLTVFVSRPTQDHVIEIDNIRAFGAGPGQPPPNLFPFIDEFGQYIHRDWPGKTHAMADLARRREAEANDLDQNPGPKEWDRYGGWRNGPALKATGFFRAEKHKGKWWLVDPEGRIFFSHGVDCVRANGATAVEDRDRWFCGLSEREGGFKVCYGKRGSRCPRYVGKRPLCFDFALANVMRKYGAQCREAHGEIAHRRLRSWGMNTIANWSSSDIYLMRKTPYVVSIHFGRKNLQIATTHWKTFPDVLNPDFEKALRQRMSREKGKSVDDPWCIGYFVDNELPWQNETALAIATLKAPAEQAAKKAFIQDLKARHVTIEKLNAAWGTRHASWADLLQHQKPPDPEKARDDLVAFCEKLADQYFRLCRKVVKEVAPNNLYLGCRFSNCNPIAADAAAKYCDVVSYNLYRTPKQLANWRPHTKADVPLIIGEFHFGALDRGMLHTGLRGVESQEERGATYGEYVQTVLRHPQFVGCHWFKYRDQPTTGRVSDGENYQIGFVDICDTPYPETIQACREVAHDMYEARLSGR